MLQTNHFHYTSIQWNSMQQSFSAKDRGLNQSRRVPPFMEPDSSLSCSQNARIELLHIVGVHESSDFIINFIFFFPRCILVTYAVSSKLCNLNVVQTAISTIPPTSSSYFFFLILFNIIYFSKGLFVKFTTIHFYPNSIYLVHLSYKYYPLYFIFKNPQSVFFTFINKQSNKCL